MILINNIYKSFRGGVGERRNHVLTGLTFRIHEGKVTGVLGPNGSGKTTTIRMILGFLQIDQGEIQFGDQLGGCLQSAKNKIGFMPEDSSFGQQLTGREFLTYMGTLARISSAQIRMQIEHWASRLSITDALGRQIKGYSKGMKQRLAMVNALLHDPQLLILDEPLASLDPIGRVEMREIMQELKHQGKTIFFSSHIISDVERVCERVVLLDRGQVLFNSPLSDLVATTAVGDRYTINYHSSASGREGESAEVTGEEKEQLIASIILDGGTIDRVTPEVVTLEEAVYNLQDRG